MTVIRPNSVSGITSLTALGNSIDFYNASGAGIQFNNVNLNNTSGVSTFSSINVTGNVSIAGTLTYEDVTNVDSIGLVTARSGVRVTGGNLLVGTSSSTGTSSQTLQVTGGAYVSGNLGVGATNPKATVQITGNYLSAASPTLGVATGNVYITNSDTAYGLLIGNSSAAGHSWLQAQRTDGTATSYNLVLQPSGGSIGIGTIVPTFNAATGTICHVHNDSSSTAWAISHYTNGTTGAGAADGIIVGTVSSTGYLFNYENAPIIFGTNATERARILAAGGITFNGDTAAANALDDYEEGTWTPTLPNGGTLTVTSASYTKIGNLVYLYFYISSVSPTNNSSEFAIGGLPFVCASTTHYPAGSIGYVGAGNLSGWTPLANNAASYVYFHFTNGTGGGARASNANWVSVNNNGPLIVTICYQTP